MGNVKDFGSVWKALVVIGSIVAAAFAVDTRYVTSNAFMEFKEGTITSLIARLDRIESKLDAVIASEKKR